MAAALALWFCANFWPSNFFRICRLCLSLPSYPELSLPQCFKIVCGGSTQQENGGGSSRAVPANTPPPPHAIGFLLPPLPPFLPPPPSPPPLVPPHKALIHHQEKKLYKNIKKFSITRSLRCHYLMDKVFLTLNIV